MKPGKAAKTTRESKTSLIDVSTKSVMWTISTEEKVDMDRSRFILAKDCEGVKPEWRGTCCDSLMFAIDDYDQVNCEKYGNRADWGRHASTFGQKMMECFLFKRDGKCPLANLM